MPYMRASHQFLLKIHKVTEFEDHFEKYGYALCKYRDVTYLVIHGSSDGELEKLPRVRELKLKFDKVICCYARSVKNKYPELDVVGTEDMPSGINFCANGIEIYLP